MSLLGTLRNLSKSVVIVALGVMVLTLANPGFATSIVNTGEDPTNPAPGLSLTNGPSFYQHLAARFTLAEATTVTSVKGWIAQLNSNGNLEIAIGNAPGNVLVSGLHAGDGGDRLSRWVGLEGLDWFLPAGDYWVSFMAQSGFNGWMSWNAPYPLSEYAFQVSDGFNSGDWFVDSSYHLGVQIEGVDVSDGGASVALLGLALLGIAAFRSKGIARGTH